MLNLDKEEPKQDSFQPVFTAEINGEPFSGTEFKQSPHAIMTKQDKYDWLVVFADMHDEQFFPYHESISFALAYNEGVSRYKTAPIEVSIENGIERRTGGRYREKDGDVPISKYEALPDGDGYITVLMDTLDDGRVVARGTFQMTVAKQYRANKYSRREADTLHITNGKYRILLEDRRPE